MGWQSMLRFVQTFLQHFTVDAPNTRVAVISYGTRATLDIDGIRTGSYDKCSFVARLHRQMGKRVPSGYSATFAALSRAVDVVVDSRRDAKKVVIVVTDGKSNIGPPPVRASIQLRSLVWDPNWDSANYGPQLQIYGFGIKDAYMPEVASIASPLPNHTYYIPTFKEFADFARSLHDDSQSESWHVVDTHLPSCNGACGAHAYCACGTKSGQYLCVCKDGFYGDGLQCQACPRGTYKDSISPARCTPCPANSTTLSEGSTDIGHCVCQPPLYQDERGQPCRIRQCDDLPDIEHGHKFHVMGRVTDELVDSGQPCTNMPDTSCHYKCDHGYRLDGHPGMICQANGTWMGRVPSCSIVDCGFLSYHDQETEQGVTTYVNGSTTYGSVVRISCPEGYSVFGDTERVCTQYGIWDGTVTWCLETRCPALSLAPSLIITPHFCGQASQPPNALCHFLCPTGYLMKGPQTVKCTDRGVWNNSLQTTCRDVEPPSIECPPDFSTPVTKANFALVHWKARPPVVTDNSDYYNLSAVGIADSPIRLTAGHHQIQYIARDRAGNEASCTQGITVLDFMVHLVKCPEAESVIHMTRHQMEVSWGEVEFADHNNVTVDHVCTPSNGSLLPAGHYHVVCVPDTKIYQVTRCQFTVILRQPECEVPHPPLHGSVTCAPTQSSLLTCKPSCNENYGFHHLPQSVYICDMQGNWNLKYNRFWPDCSRKYYPRKAMLRGHARYHYYGGNCFEVQDKIRQNFMDLLHHEAWNICGEHVCNLGDIHVTCGVDSKRRKRSLKDESNNGNNASGISEEAGNLQNDHKTSTDRKQQPSSGQTEKATTTQSDLPESGLENSTNGEIADEFPAYTNGQDFGSVDGIGDISYYDLGKAVDDQPVIDQPMLFNGTAQELQTVQESMDYSQYENDTDYSQNDDIDYKSVIIDFDVITEWPAENFTTRNQYQMYYLLSDVSDQFQKEFLGKEICLQGSNETNDCRDPLLPYKHDLEPPVFEDCNTGYVTIQGFYGFTQKCVACPTGTYYSMREDQCNSCTIGYYQTEEGQSSCIPCPGDMITNRIGADNASLCLETCAPGEYSGTGIAPCRPCPLHTFQPYGSATTCAPCPTRKKTLVAGASDISYCKDLCSPGFYSETGIIPCSPCEIGSFQPQYGGTDCLLCEDGKTTQDVGSINVSACIGWDACAATNLICQNGGRCAVSNNVVACVCQSGFSGVSCEINTPDCFETSCHNNGTCVDGINSYTCVCQPGFAGPLCEINVDECLSSPCINGGSCLDSVNSFVCYCPIDYTGERCEERVTICGDVICEHGHCMGDSIGGAACVCDLGFAGDTCNVTYDLCSSNPCLNDATCQSRPGQFTCLCQPGFTGDLCDGVIDPCSSSPCESGSTCLPTLIGTGYLCKCPGGISGLHCNEEVDSTFDLKFVLDSPDGQYVVLPREFMPQLGDFSIVTWIRPQPLSAFATIMAFTLMRPSPQESGNDHGETQNQDDFDVVFALRHTDNLIVHIFEESFPTNVTLPSYVWTHLCLIWDNSNGHWSVVVNGTAAARGVTAQSHSALPANVNIVLGQENPFHAEVSKMWDVFHGEISNFNIFSRVLSHREIFGLSSQSSCNSTFGDVIKWTDVLQFTRGDLLLTTNSFCLDINECAFPSAFPCGTNRQCIDLVGAYDCSQCSPGYTGDDCRQLADECDADPYPCGAGQCVDGPGLYDYTCTCPVQWTGDDCSIRINMCNPNPCQHGGICTLTDSGFTCQCPQRNMGPLCERPASACLPNPCQNRGRCVERTGHFFDCHCPEGFTGHLCETRTGWCDNNECFNGGTCLDASDALSRNIIMRSNQGGYCLCPHGWVGALCDVRMVPGCEQSPCLNGGTCVSTQGEERNYACICPDEPHVKFDENCEIFNPCLSSPCPNDTLCVLLSNYTFSCICKEDDYCSAGHSVVNISSYNYSGPHVNQHDNSGRRDAKEVPKLALYLTASIIPACLLLCAFSTCVCVVWRRRRRKRKSVDREILTNAADVALHNVTNHGFHTEDNAEESTYAELSDEYAVSHEDTDDGDAGISRLSPHGSITISLQREFRNGRTISSASSGSFASIRSSLSRKSHQNADETNLPLLADDYLEPIGVLQKVPTEEIQIEQEDTVSGKVPLPSDQHENPFANSCMVPGSSNNECRRMILEDFSRLTVPNIMTKSARDSSPKIFRGNIVIEDFSQKKRNHKKKRFAKDTSLGRNDQFSADGYLERNPTVSNNVKDEPSQTMNPRLPNGNKTETPGTSKKLVIQKRELPPIPD